METLTIDNKQHKIMAYKNGDIKSIKKDQNLVNLYDQSITIKTTLKKKVFKRAPFIITVLLLIVMSAALLKEPEYQSSQGGKGLITGISNSITRANHEMSKKMLMGPYIILISYGSYLVLSYMAKSDQMIMNLSNHDGMMAVLVVDVDTYQRLAFDKIEKQTINTEH